jgi:hypothetical protein
LAADTVREDIGERITRLLPRSRPGGGVMQIALHTLPEVLACAATCHAFSR